jgi:hypothetical protein
MTMLDLPATESDRRLLGGKGTFPHDSLTSRSEGRCHPKGRSAAEEARSALTLAFAEATPTVLSGEIPLRILLNAPSRSRRTSTAFVWGPTSNTPIIPTHKRAPKAQQMESAGRVRARATLRLWAASAVEAS